MAGLGILGLMAAALYSIYSDNGKKIVVTCTTLRNIGRLSTKVVSLAPK